ncbi:MAG: TonB-dependent receptor plug domain-containing protein [Gemmatimonadaceae bacterium]
MRLIAIGWRSMTGLAMAASIAGSSRSAQAQHACAPERVPTAAGQRWAPPLDTPLSLHASDITLRDALDRVSALAKVQLAYASDLLPLDRHVCVDAGDLPMGRVLAALLVGTRMEPSVVAGRVVLAPRADTSARTDDMARAVGTLERVLVTGNAAGSPRRALTIGVEVIDGAQLRRQSLLTLPAILNASAPGLWMWDQPASSLVAQYGGIRGASSFTSSYPKIYIDGVEVANPLLVTQFDPDVIDRVEVIRGPQGAALYGSDAISGVINIVTRHDAGDGSYGLRVSSSAGAGATAYGAGPVATHDQRIAFRRGTSLHSVGAAVVYGQLGAVTPGAESRELLASGDVRLVGSRATITASGRFVDKRAGAGDNPLLADVLSANLDDVTASPATSTTPQSARQYTVGTTATIATGGRWTHTAVVGVDGYSLKNVADVSGPFSIGSDSALRAAQGTGDRVTLRGSTTGEFGDVDGVAPLRLTFGVEHAVLRQVRAVSAMTPPTGVARYGTATQTEAQSWNHNTGVFSQLSAQWANSFYLSGGLRVERNDSFSGPDRYPLLPMLGVAVVRDLGPIQLKLRSAYGKGIRSPQTASRTTSVLQRQRDVLAPALDPELQSGVESGVEMYVGSGFSLQATRFDQVASGLIQNVAVAVDTQMRGATAVQRVRYQLQNIGEISNHGWEMQAAAQRGPFTLASTFTMVDSRVRRLALGYFGDLRPDDRILAVPARTGSLMGSWTGSRWFASLTATRAWDWIDYDRLALTRAYTAANGPSPNDLVGPHLRAYWLNYWGQTHLRLASSFTLRPALDLLLTAENLLGGQLGEPDNVTIRAGRTISGGLRASF